MLQSLIKGLLLSCLLVAASAQADRQMIDRVIAVVDDDVILQSELDARVRTIVSRLNAQGTPLPPEEVMQQRVLDQLILDSIQLQLADRQGMRISDSELNDTMRNIAARNGFSLEEFEQALASEGLTYREAREQIRQEMLTSRVQQRWVGQRVRVTDREISNYLESAAGRERSGVEYLLGHILVSVSNFNDSDAVEAAEAKAQRIRQELLEGRDFREAAVAESDGRNALQGGELGWRREEQLPSLASGVIPDLGVGEPSEVLRSGSGFHIVTPLDRRGGAEEMVQQHQVRHILVQPDEFDPQDDPEARIRALYDRLQQGEDFATLAREYSDDPGSASAGGSLDWVSPGEMVPEFEETMESAEVGQVSTPFRSQFGWHVLKVEDRRMQDIGQEVQRNEARQAIYQRKFELELQTWLREIRDDAYVDIKLVFGLPELGS